MLLSLSRITCEISSVSHGVELGFLIVKVLYGAKVSNSSVKTFSKTVTLSLTLSTEKTFSHIAVSAALLKPCSSKFLKSRLVTVMGLKTSFFKEYAIYSRKWSLTPGTSQALENRTFSGFLTKKRSISVLDLSVILVGFLIN